MMHVHASSTRTASGGWVGERVCMHQAMMAHDVDLACGVWAKRHVHAPSTRTASGACESLHARVNQSWHDGVWVCVVSAMMHAHAPRACTDTVRV